ncbi:hypothetical protein K3495_g12597 [Podosphaera aphanis]|nr:hypothetical protein K3495_g12597 [Podosphaera aphanis]
MTVPLPDLVKWELEQITGLTIRSTKNSRRLRESKFHWSELITVALSIIATLSYPIVNAFSQQGEVFSSERDEVFTFNSRKNFLGYYTLFGSRQRSRATVSEGLGSVMSTKNTRSTIRRPEIEVESDKCASQYYLTVAELNNATGGVFDLKRENPDVSGEPTSGLEHFLHPELLDASFYVAVLDMIERENGGQVFIYTKTRNPKLTVNDWYELPFQGGISTVEIKEGKNRAVTFLYGKQVEHNSVGTPADAVRFRIERGCGRIRLSIEYFGFSGNPVDPDFGKNITVIKFVEVITSAWVSPKTDNYKADEYTHVVTLADVLTYNTTSRDDFLVDDFTYRSIAKEEVNLTLGSFTVSPGAIYHTYDINVLISTSSVAEGETRTASTVGFIIIIVLSLTGVLIRLSNPNFINNSLAENLYRSALSSYNGLCVSRDKSFLNKLWLAERYVRDLNDLVFNEKANHLGVQFVEGMGLHAFPNDPERSVSVYKLNLKKILECADGYPPKEGSNAVGTGAATDMMEAVDRAAVGLLAVPYADGDTQPSKE